MWTRGASVVWTSTVGLLLWASAADGVALHGRLSTPVHRPQPLRAAVVSLVTEDDVEKLVEKAESLWADALAAREKADSLSAEAEQLADVSEKQSQAAVEALEESDKFSLSMLTSSQGATDASLEATRLLAEAVDAAEEAARIEEEAEQALIESEAALEQHLADFPDAE